MEPEKLPTVDEIIKGDKIINEQIFGKQLSQVEADKGITHAKIELQDIGNIPGIIEHWDKDVARRTKDILAWKNQSFVQRAANLLRSKRSAITEVSGEELYLIHPSKEAQRLLKTLSNNPADKTARLELVSLIGKSGRDFPLEVYRTLFLQATVACNYGKLFNLDLQVALWAQNIYLTKFYTKAKEQINKLEQKLDQLNRSNAYDGQIEVMQTLIAGMRRNMLIIEAYQRHINKGVQGTQASFPASISLEEVQEYALDVAKNKDEKRKILLKKASEITFLVRFIPLLHNNVLEVLSHLVKIDQTNPLVYFLQGKIWMSDVVFKVSQYLAGHRDLKLVKSIEESFKQTYHFYGTAVTKIGKSTTSPVEHSILMEYANLVHYFYRIGVKILGLHPPKSWLLSTFTRAERALSMTVDQNKAAPLLADIERDIREVSLGEDD